MHHYSSEEDMILLKYYGKIQIAKLLDLLPDRTENSVRSRYLRLIGRITVRKSTYVTRAKSGGWDENDQYLNQIFHEFCRYVAISQSLIKKRNSKPNVQYMMTTFRDIYKRSIESDSSKTVSN